MTTKIHHGSDCLTFGGVCKVVAAAAILAVMTVYPIAQLSGLAFHPAGEQSDLRGFLCRIDHRCPTTNLDARTMPGTHVAEAAAR